MDLIQWTTGRQLERLAELTAVNGGWRVTRIVQASTPTTENRYGRSGLLVHEALELAFLHGAFEALATAHPDQKQACTEAIEREASGCAIQLFTTGDMRCRIPGAR